MLSSITLNAVRSGTPTSRVDRVATGSQNAPTLDRIEGSVARAGNSAVKASVGPVSQGPVRQNTEVVELSIRSRQMANAVKRGNASDGGSVGSSTVLSVGGSPPNDSSTFALSKEGGPTAADDQRPDERDRKAFGVIDSFSESEAAQSVFDTPSTDPLVNIFDSKAEAPKRTVASSKGNELSEQDKAKLRELKQRDQELRAQEQARALAQGVEGGGGKGPVRLVVERGPDGKEYVTNGNVSIDVSAVKDDPQATIIKMWRAQAAALASGSATGLDQQVGALTNARLTEALQELAKERFTAMQGNSDAESPKTTGLKLTA